MRALSLLDRVAYRGHESPGDPSGGTQGSALKGALETLAPGPWLERPDSPDGVVTAVRRLPPVAAKYAAVPRRARPPAPRRARAPRRRAALLPPGRAFAHVAAGGNVVVTTPTASGKTLCYNLPVLDTILKDPATRALYLFPTKALAQDQMAELHELVGAGERRRRRGDRRPHLRRRHAGRRAPDDSHARARRAQQSRHAARGHPAASSALGEAVREPALRRHRRAARVSRRVRQPSCATCCAACVASRVITARIRSSSARRRRSPTRASSPNASPSGRSRSSPRAAPRAARSSSSSSIRRSSIASWASAARISAKRDASRASSCAATCR